MIETFSIINTFRFAYGANGGSEQNYLKNKLNFLKIKPSIWKMSKLKRNRRSEDNNTISCNCKDKILNVHYIAWKYILKDNI